MSTGQNAVMLCSFGVKAGWLIPYMWINVWVEGKTVLTRANLGALSPVYTIQPVVKPVVKPV